MQGKKNVVALFGDSIMYGSGNNGFGVGEYLEKDMNFTLKKFCIGGARVGYQEGKSWVVEQVKKAITQGISPDLIVFDGFTNDCNIVEGNTECDVEFGEKFLKKDETVYDIKPTDANFTKCFNAVAYSFLKYFPHAKVVFVRPHNMGRRGDEVQKKYGTRAVEISKAYGFSVADIYSDSDLNTFKEEDRDKYTFDSYGWGKGDCTHPNDICYREKYMPIIEEVIKKL